MVPARLWSADWCCQGLKGLWGACQIVERGVALLGYAAIGSGGLVLPGC